MSNKFVQAVGMDSASSILLNDPNMVNVFEKLMEMNEKKQSSEAFGEENLDDVGASSIVSMDVD